MGDRNIVQHDRRNSALMRSGAWAGRDESAIARLETGDEYVLFADRQTAAGAEFPSGCRVVIGQTSRAAAEAAGGGSGWASCSSPPSLRTDGLRRVLIDDDYRAGLRARSVRRARAFSWERSAQQVVELFHEVGLSGRPPRKPVCTNL